MPRSSRSANARNASRRCMRRHRRGRPCDRQSHVQPSPSVADELARRARTSARRRAGTERCARSRAAPLSSAARPRAPVHDRRGAAAGRAHGHVGSQRDRLGLARHGTAHRRAARSRARRRHRAHARRPQSCTTVRISCCRCCRSSCASWRARLALDAYRRVDASRMRPACSAPAASCRRILRSAVSACPISRTSAQSCATATDPGRRDGTLSAWPQAFASCAADG